MQLEHETSSRNAFEPGNHASRSNFLAAALLSSPAEDLMISVTVNRIFTMTPHSRVGGLAELVGGGGCGTTFIKLQKGYSRDNFVTLSVSGQSGKTGHSSLSGPLSYTPYQPTISWLIETTV